MRILLTTLASLFSTFAYAQTSLRYFENEAYKEIKIATYQGAHFSADCVKAGKISCQAWTAYSGKAVSATKPDLPLAGNPAAQYCGALNVKNRILKAANNSQYDYCVFDDGSMVDSWDLFYKHFPKKN